MKLLNLNIIFLYKNFTTYINPIYNNTNHAVGVKNIHKIGKLSLELDSIIPIIAKIEDNANNTPNNSKEYTPEIIRKINKILVQNISDFLIFFIIIYFNYSFEYVNIVLIITMFVSMNAILPVIPHNKGLKPHTIKDNIK